MSNLICEHCHKNVGTVTVIEIPKGVVGDETQPATQQVLCEICAQAKNLPHAPVTKKSLGDIWKLLQASSAASPDTADVVCPECGMSLRELRAKGRIGCANDYELFAEDILEILERMHGATEHEGRTPSLSQAEVSRIQAITDLQKDLDEAIRDEAYENAARIRDELQSLGGPANSPQVG
ncbi:MAG: UvrB/UvrC motif-containing protein [Planctomycetota bacterium]|jgi:protein arginine kinase activator|nr:UvrB/UvrC motif-containing protein [Planctomycetota bacterium]